MPKNKSTSKTKTAKLTINENTYELPIYNSTEGESVIDISKLHSQAKLFTYDPGFTSTASCESKITFIDGDKGILIYRVFFKKQSAWCRQESKHVQIVLKSQPLERGPLYKPRILICKNTISDPIV